LIPALRRQISEFKASLVYRVSSRIARTTQRNTVSENKRQKKQNPTKKKIMSRRPESICYSRSVVPTQRC
jgi:predicted Holliday junction resolvase-like endonuclease